MVPAGPVWVRELVGNAALLFFPFIHPPLQLVLLSVAKDLEPLELHSC